MTTSHNQSNNQPMPKKPTKKSKPVKSLTNDIEPISAYQPKPKVEPQVKIGSMGGIDIIDRPFKVNLSVPLLAAYLKRGVSQIEIANLTGTTRQAVNQYIDRHSDELAPLIDKDDGIIAAKAKYLHDKAMGKLIDLVDSASNKDMMALNCVSGTHFDKYRLGTNQSTANTSSWMHIINDTPV